MVADRGCPRSIDNVGKSAYFGARYWRFPCQAFMKSPPACNCTDLVVHEEMPENFRIHSAFHEPFLLVELPWGDEKISTTLRHRCFRPSADGRLCVTGLLLTYEHVRRSSAPGGSTAGIREQRQLKRQFGNNGERLLAAPSDRDFLFPRTETCRSVPTASRPAGLSASDGLVATQNGHPDFSEAAVQADWATASFVATKLPFVTSHIRPSVATR